MKPKVEVTGVDDVHRLLTQVAPREAQNLLRATVHGVAGEIRDEAKADVPEVDGTLKKSIKTKRERVRRGRILSTVRVLQDAFYWRFLEYGTASGHREHGFFLRAFEKVAAKLTQVLVTQFGKKWEAAMKRAARRNGR